jgi:hypothetical protein
MSPSISIIHNSKSKILFNKKFSDIRSKKYTYTFLKNNFISSDNDAIIIIRCDYNYCLDEILEFIKTKNINKITFFIDDVFRIKVKTDLNFLDTYMIEETDVEYEILELNIIKNILKNTNVRYEIYHCEIDYNKNIYKKFNVNLRYFDIFLLEYVSNSIDFNKEINLNFNNKISCFNNRKEIHRYFIACLLSKEQDCLISLNHTYDLEKIIENKSLPLEKFSNEFKSQLLNSIKTLNPKSLLLDSNNTRMLPAFIQHSPTVIVRISDSFLNVVTETRFSSPMQNISEKTIKPVIAGRPFIALATPFHLKTLKDLGFKTFDKWWSEDYDSIVDHNLRFQEIHNNIKRIIDKPKEELEKMLFDMRDILIHNRNNLTNLEEKLLNYSRVLP